MAYDPLAHHTTIFRPETVLRRAWHKGHKAPAGNADPMASGTTQEEQQPGWIDRIKEADASELTSKVDERLTEWRDQIEELEEDAKEVSEEVEAELGARIALVKGTADQLEDRIDELGARGEDQADEIKSSIQALVIGLRRDLDDLESRLKER